MASENAEEEMKPVDPPKEAEGEDDEATPEKKARRRRRSSEVAAEGTPAERPSRERKTVERYSAVSPKRASATKSLSIKQGSGMKLQDIPNVVFKLSKRKVDENLQALHTLLFGRKSNVHKLKRNIFQFSGFVWPENEEKLRAKLKEKLDKYNKDKLAYFCELLDIHSLKASAKKEELTSKLLEFLESPHITRDVLLSEKEKKGKKRVRKTKGETPTPREKKKMKSSEPEVKKRKGKPSQVEEQQEEDDEDGSTGTKDASSDEEDAGNSEEERKQVNSEDEDEDVNDETEKPVASKKGHTEKAERIDEPKIEENTSPVKEGSPAKSSKSPSRPASKKASVPAEDEPDMDVDNKQGSTKEQTKKASKATSREKGAKVKKEDTKKSQRKGSSGDVSVKGPTSSSKSTKEDKKKAKSKEKPVHEDKKARKKKEDKSRSRVPDKEQGKGKTNARPSTEELRSVISSILKEVDFNTATLADILKQLGAHFKIDLMDRKTEVKQIIEEVINSMTDDEDVDEDED
ncbi:protein DEK-like isoform X1 [Iris pallida]|uniref:Protein DEK-like isoform X1 n=1 Tax=Iris pallida TaxID=29817 RepID=A0AAX6GUL1_IRIPA|nr:protein DEK-like isoform X1 [Iris pallida]KAJ6848887.1 protein DEK-like isoform X1 [Iris pallida]